MVTVVRLAAAEPRREPRAIALQRLEVQQERRAERQRAPQAQLPATARRS